MLPETFCQKKRSYSKITEKRTFYPKITEKRTFWPKKTEKERNSRAQKKRTSFFGTSSGNTVDPRVVKNSELKGAHFEIFQGFSSNFAKNVRFLYYREANKKRHVPLKVAPMCSKVHATLIDRSL